jgi:hypothetical protein
VSCPLCDLLAHDVTADRVGQLVDPADLDGAGDVATVVGGGPFVDLDEDNAVGSDILLGSAGRDQDVLAVHEAPSFLVWADQYGDRGGRRFSQGHAGRRGLDIEQSRSVGKDTHE